MNDRLDNLVAEWASVGVAFNAEPGADTPDLERLLLDTARSASGMARLFVMAATWLHTYGDLVAKHRLKRLAQQELEPEFRPVLGLLLDIAQQGTHPPEFQSVIRTLARAERARPLFDSERSHELLSRRAERRATELSRKWNLFCGPIEFKDDAIRPASWIMRRHRSFVIRADFRGDLRASVLASLQHDPGAGESELRLARAAGGSRAQTRSALANLEMTGRVRRRRTQGAKRTEIECTRAV